MRGRIYRALCLALGVVFIAAALPKISDPRAFALAVFRYRLLPGPLVYPVALILPWAECFAGLSLVFLPAWRRAAAVLAAGLLVLFVAAQGAALLRGLDIACGCFGAGDLVGLPTLLRTLLLLAAAVYCCRPERQRSGTA